MSQICRTLLFLCSPPGVLSVSLPVLLTGFLCTWTLHLFVLHVWCVVSEITDQSLFIVPLQVWSVRALRQATLMVFAAETGDGEVSAGYCLLKIWSFFMDLDNDSQVHMWLWDCRLRELVLPTCLELSAGLHHQHTVWTAVFISHTFGRNIKLPSRLSEESVLIVSSSISSCSSPLSGHGCSTTSGSPLPPL